VVPGNIGVNNAAGNFNQQKNNLAIAVSGGRVAKPLLLPTKAPLACKSATTALRPTKRYPHRHRRRRRRIRRRGQGYHRRTNGQAVMATTTEAMAAMAAAKIRKPPSKLWVPSAWLGHHSTSADPRWLENPVTNNASMTNVRQQLVR
jgi:hypothetical protein